MRLTSLTLTLLLLTGCGSGLLGLSNGSDSGGNSPYSSAPVGIFVGTVATNSFSDTPGSTYPPNGLVAVSSGQFNDLSNPSTSNQTTFTTTGACSSSNSGPFEVIDFVFDVGAVNLPSYDSMQILINSASAGSSSTPGAAPFAGSGTVRIFDANGSGNWILPSNSGSIAHNNNSLGFGVSGPFGGWAWTPTGGPGSNQFILISMRSGTCSNGEFPSVSLMNIQLTIQ